MGRWMNAWMDGWMDGWMEGWMDDYVLISTNGLDGCKYNVEEIVQQISSSHNSSKRMHFIQMGVSLCTWYGAL